MNNRALIVHGTQEIENYRCGLLTSRNTRPSDNKQRKNNIKGLEQWAFSPAPPVLASRARNSHGSATVIHRPRKAEDDANSIRSMKYASQLPKGKISHRAICSTDSGEQSCCYELPKLPMLFNFPALGIFCIHITSV